MNLTKIMLVGGSENITLNIDNAHPSDEYLFLGADGFGPTEVGVVMTNGVLQSRLPQDREIIIRVGPNPDYSINQTVSELRDKLYSLLTGPLDSKIFVTFYDELDAFCYAEGYVSKVEIVIFDEEPIVQITIPCRTSYLTSFQQVEFSNLNKSLFGVENTGTEITGFEFGVQFTSPTTSWRVTNVGTGEYMEFVDQFATGDQLLVGTQKRERYIRRVREGVSINRVGSLTAGSDWFTLKTDDNSFQTSAQNFNWLYVKYTPKYLGV